MASSMKDVETVMMLHKNILLFGLENAPIDKALIVAAKESAKRLQEDDMFRFNFDDDISFFQSVVDFSRSFFK